jgi:quercetin dioxygenase-like cupin family protein
MVKAKEIQWGPAPDSLPKGAEATVLSGDPAKAGPFALRLKVPAGYKVPRHWHPVAEEVTMIEGDFHFTMGDDGKTHDAEFGAGDYVNLPANMKHEAWTKNGAIVQVNMMGPFVITYVDPKDDPRNANKAAAASK